jgi:hypothetical protein
MRARFVVFSKSNHIMVHLSFRSYKPLPTTTCSHKKLRSVLNLLVCFAPKKKEIDNRNNNINIIMKVQIFTTIALVSSVAFGPRIVRATFDCTPLPDIQTLIDTAFPPWDIDANENRIAGTGKWNPIYLTKRWNGLDASKGGYPTEVDTRYPFYYAAAFLGQPGGGGNRHCPKDAPDDHPIHKCPKVETASDNDAQYGPGHIPPHISLSSVRRGYAAACNDASMNVADWFDFTSATPCDIKSDKLLELVRRYYPRDPVTGANPEYPKPNVPGAPEFYELEFPSETGSPHYCTAEYLALDLNSDFCPYIYEGENRGKYRHPHLALAAVQQYLAHALNPTVCGTEWSVYDKYPANPDLSIAFCEMESDTQGDAQPVIPYTWPENGDPKIKSVPGLTLWTPPAPATRALRRRRRVE